MRTEHVCEICFPDVEEIGWFCQGYMLAKIEGKYLIMGGQGHKKEDAFYFPEKPTPDPDPNDEQSVRFV